MSNNSSITTVQPTKRIEYIDALRGFTMILVVLFHVAHFCLHVDEVPSVHHYLLQVRMPMFFFISGFVLYKNGVIWNGAQLISFFRKKIPVQLISPFLFFAIYLYSHNSPIISGSLNPTKMGYWFTFALFEYYVFYAVIMSIVRNKYASIIMLVLGIFLYGINYHVLYDAIPLTDEVKGFLSMTQWCYFIFFVLGTIAKRYFQQFQVLLDNKWVLPFCILFYVLTNVFSDVIPVKDVIVSLPRTIAGLVVLFSFFRINQRLFSKEHALGRAFQYIGRRTLDIYLIHYFLLPVNLGFITVFIEHPMPVLEATFSLIVALIIIGACLLISNILRLSPFLAHWLFGARYQTNK